MAIDFQRELNAEQLKVVMEGNGPTLVLAGAGSGKTRTLVYRVAYLLEQGVKPYEILLVTFTNKAANEMTERMEHLLGYKPTGLWSGTFHSIANRLLRQHAGVLGYEDNYTILDQDDAKQLMKICVKEAKVPKGRRFPSPAVLLSLGSFARNAACGLQAAIEARSPHFVELASDIERILDLYEKKKREANSMDFDDLLLNLHTLLVEAPEIEDQLAQRFKYILVDEYQDTNTLQANIVTRLAKVHRNLLVVGDDAQSIYSFRAADIQNILRFPNLFQSSQTFRLETNYRSTPQILRLANESILYNQNQFQKELRAHNADGGKPKRTSHRTPRTEAAYIADQIASVLESGIPPKEIAVLFRAAYQSQALEFELMKRGVTYEYRGGMRFFERAHVKDALAFLRVQENQKDTAAWLRVLGMQVGVGPATAQKIIGIVRDTPIEEWFIEETFARMPKRAQEGWRATQKMLEPVLTKNTLSEQLRALSTTPYVEYLEHQYTNPADRLTDIDQLSMFAAQYTERSVFLEEVTLADVLSSEQGAALNQVVLSTVHQSKGLEWDAVFVMSLTDGGFPSRRSLEDDSAIEEERRLFYVAVTRARKHLYLTYPTVGMGDGFQGLSPSMFLEELSHDLIENDRPVSSGRSYLRPVSTPTWDDAYQEDYSDKEESINLDIF